MPKKKAVSTELVSNLDARHWVQKSDPLVMMRSVPFTLGELKILDTYISRINASDDTRRTVVFTKEEYEELMGLTCADPRALCKHIKALLSRVPELYLPDDGYIPFVLFEKAFYHKDEYGKPIIELTCTETSKDLFFCIGKYHYFSYELENIIKLNRKSSYLLYLYIRTNRYRSSWEIDLDELRDSVLDCKNSKSYQEFKEFKKAVLDPAVKEINEKTDCHFEYETVKRCRKVAKIKFLYKSQDELEGQLTFEQIPEQVQVSEIVEESEDMPEIVDDEELRLKHFDGDEELSILSEAVKDEFSVEDITHIREILRRIPDIPPDRNLPAGRLANIYGRAAYLREQYAKLNAASKKKLIHGGKGINDRCAYFKQMLEKAAKGE